MLELSVLMSVYREYEFIDSAIESVLNQTYREFEFIIIDDSDEKKMHDKLKIISETDNRIKLVVNNQNLGLTKSLNKGLKLCNGIYVARMDADDICLPMRFEKQINYFHKNTATVLLGSFAKIINERNQEIGKIKLNTENKKISNYHFLRNQFVHPSVMFELRKILKLGGYNENLKTAQDGELWTRVILNYEVANLKDELIKYRIHQNSITKTRNISQRKNAIKYQFKNVYSFEKINIKQFVFGNLNIIKNIIKIIIKKLI